MQTADKLAINQNIHTEMLLHGTQSYVGNNAIIN